MEYPTDRMSYRQKEGRDTSLEGGLLEVQTKSHIVTNGSYDEFIRE